MDKVFAFDMDGVIADTLGALYRCYLDLLAAHGVEAAIVAQSCRGKEKQNYK